MPKEVIIKLTSKSKFVGWVDGHFLSITNTHILTIVTSYKWDRILIIMPFKSRCQLSEITANRKRCFFGNFVAAVECVFFLLLFSFNYWYYYYAINIFMHDCRIQANLKWLKWDPLKRKKCFWLNEFFFQWVLPLPLLSPLLLLLLYTFHFISFEFVTMNF